MDWHLKVKNTKLDVGLAKKYCITIAMQKISSNHKLILDHAMAIMTAPSQKPLK